MFVFLTNMEENYRAGKARQMDVLPLRSFGHVDTEMLLLLLCVSNLRSTSS